jgi:hypothetical protein
VSFLLLDAVLLLFEFSRSLAVQGPEKTLQKNVLLMACAVAVVRTVVAPW